MIHLLAQTAPVYPNLPDSWELTARILLAAVLGAILGLERELNDHPSGLRTHITVAMGSALFAIAGAYSFHEFVALRNSNNYSLDPTRIAAQIVSGVGFLGAGAIIKQGNTVRGLTSAAGLWVSAAVGMAVAFGMYLEAVMTTVILTILLVLLKRPRSWIRNRASTVRETVVISLPLDQDPSEVITALGGLDDTVIRSLHVKRDEDEGLTLVTAELENRGGTLDSKLAGIESRADVLSVETE